MQAIQYVFNAAIDIYILLIFVMVVLSWLLQFNVVNRGNQIVNSIWTACVAVTEPLLRPIRNVLPFLGGLDLSPIVALIGLNAVRIFANAYVFGPMINRGL